MPGAYLLASRLDRDRHALLRYVADRLLPLAAAAALHDRSLGTAWWAALAWLAYLGVYELFYAWNDRRGIPTERSAPAIDLLVPRVALARCALLGVVVAAACSPVGPANASLQRFGVVFGSVAIVFAVHNRLHEARAARIKTATFGLLAALRFMPVAALLMPGPLLAVVWAANLCADALPRTVDYWMRKAAWSDRAHRVRLYRRLKAAGLLLGLAAAGTVAVIRYPAENGLLPATMVFLLVYPGLRAVATLAAWVVQRLES